MEEFNINAQKFFVGTISKGYVLKITVLDLNGDYIYLDLNFNEVCSYVMNVETSDNEYFMLFNAAGVNSKGKSVCYRIKLPYAEYYAHCVMEFGKLVPNQKKQGY